MRIIADLGPTFRDLSICTLFKRGIAYGFPTSSTTLDEVAFKMIVSDAADRQRYLTKADVKSAYTNAWTSRGKRFLKCPDTAQEFDEDGTPMVLELGPPLFGEPEAGREWQMTLEADLAELGWVPAENVPCMWRMCRRRTTTASSEPSSMISSSRRRQATP